ncbi:hypothetical protein J4E05_03350 [Thalassospira sp. NFXS8]|uniref:hypothetical protein n=1 Tax=Thalassospira sp. NFXS8 TaxID=2819093 RepID=UPI0032DF0542
MEERERPERGPQDKAPTAFVSESKLQETRRVLSPATQSSMNKYDRSDVIEREFEGKKAAAIERLAAKGINVARIGPDPALKNGRGSDQFVWDTGNTPSVNPGETPGENRAAAPPSYNWGQGDLHETDANKNAAIADANTSRGDAPTDQPQDAVEKPQPENSKTDDLLSRFTQVPSNDAAASVPNPDLTDMAIEHHGLRLPDKKPGTPKAPKPVATEPVDQLHAGRKRATAESYAALDSLASRPPKPVEKPQRKGVERWAPRIGAYMIAAIAVGYVLVLTMIELYSLF